MVAARWKRSSSMWRAGATKPRPRNDHGDRKRPRILAAARGGDDAALLVSLALVLPAADRADLLARGADDHLGLHPILRDAECRFFRPRRRHADRRGIAL